MVENETERGWPQCCVEFGCACTQNGAGTFMAEIWSTTSLPCQSGAGALSELSQFQLSW